MIEIKDFNSKLELGLARILEKTEENIVVAYKQWDTEEAKLGKLVEKAEEIAVQSIKDLEDRKIELQKQIDEIDTFLAFLALK